MATVSERAGIVSTTGSLEPAWVGGGKERIRGRRGMEVPRVFSTEGVSPFDQVEWELRTAEIKDERGRAIFQQTDCEIPASLEPARDQRRCRASTSTATWPAATAARPRGSASIRFASWSTA